MKKFLAVGAVTLAVSAAHASEVKFGDLNYFLKQGQMNLKSDLDLSREETREDGTRFEVEGYISHNRLSFGVMDNVTAFVGLNYLYEMDTKATGAAASENNGFMNPMVGVDLRLLDQKTSGFNFDLGAVVDYNLRDSEVAAANKDNGNQSSALFSKFGDPRSSVGVNARIGNKWNEANEWYALAAATYNMSGEQKDLDTKEDYEFDGSMDLELGGFYQYRPVNEFMMTLGVVVTRYGEMEGEFQGSDFTVPSYMDMHFSFNAKYLITETFIAKFSFTKDRRDEYDIENDVGADTEFARRRGNTYGVGVDFLF
jgi:hypothetical protein